MYILNGRFGDLSKSSKSTFINKNGHELNILIVSKMFLEDT